MTPLSVCVRCAGLALKSDYPLRDETEIALLFGGSGGIGGVKKLIG